MLKQTLSALDLLKRLLNFSQTCTGILLGYAKNFLNFGHFDPIFKVTGGQRT